MKASEKECNTDSLSNHSTSVSHKLHEGRNYTRAHDDRKRPVRGLWVRNGRFYAQMTVSDPNSGRKRVKRLPLESTSIGAAKKEMEKLKVKREENALPLTSRTPKWADYVQEYLEHYAQVKDAKRPSTLQKEKGILKLWSEHLGDIRLHRITRVHITSFLAKRQAAGISGRTVNLDVIALRNVLKKAREEGHVQALPTENLRPLKWTAPKRELFTLTQIESICQKASELSKNGVEFGDYLRLMAFCGGRRDETLRLRWTDVDWERKQLVVGGDGLAKNHEMRFVDFNPNLQSHLKKMNARRAPDSQFLFPSPQRGEKDHRAKTFKETLNRAREATGLQTFCFHDCRHFFISMCVMSGIDFMTIATWVGHKDGGILIGKVYGHLADSHRKSMATKLDFIHGNQAGTTNGIAIKGQNRDRGCFLP